MRAFRLMFYTGAVVQVISAAVHFFGMTQRHVPSNEQERMLHDLMHSYRFDLGAGFVRTMSDFLLGFGLVYGAFILFFGLINVLAIRRAGNSRFLRSLCWLNVMCMATLVGVAAKFFVLVPLLFSLVPLVAFLGAALTVPPQEL